MSKYIIDTEAGTCQPYGEPISLNIVDLLARYEGATEYDSVVTMIQNWFYGKLIKAPWCATCMSWAFNKLGIQVDKAENVYTLMRNCQYAATQGHGTFYSKSELPELKRGDVCFLLFSGTTMTTTSNKHVTAFVKDAGMGRIRCIGGNQSDQIKVSDYDRSNLYAVYRP
nr:MAG TPA: TIGR02594 family protein [Caudoviricetes sp.]